MIFFIDEDYHLYDPWIQTMKERGHAVESVWNANHAYRRLHGESPGDIDLAIIDVMLAVDGTLDTEDEQFSHARTDGYLKTGLILLDDLAQANPRAFPRRAVLLTNAIGKETLTAAQESRDRHGIELWAKSWFSSAVEFADRVDEYMERLRDEDEDQK